MEEGRWGFIVLFFLQQWYTNAFFLKLDVISKKLTGELCFKTNSLSINSMYTIWITILIHIECLYSAVSSSRFLRHRHV